MGYAAAMERCEFPIRGEAEEWVAAVERGDEVVLTRNGKPIASVTATPVSGGSLDRTALETLRRSMRELRVADGAAMIRELRDASDH